MSNIQFVLKMGASPSTFNEILDFLIEHTFTREGLRYLACNEKRPLFLHLNNLKDLNCGHVRKFVTLSIIFFENICIRFGSTLYRQIVDIPMGTNCAPLVKFACVL